MAETLGSFDFTPLDWSAFNIEDWLAPLCPQSATTAHQLVAQVVPRETVLALLDTKLVPRPLFAKPMFLGIENSMLKEAINGNLVLNSVRN